MWVNNNALGYNQVNATPANDDADITHTVYLIRSWLPGQPVKRRMRLPISSVGQLISNTVLIIQLMEDLHRKGTGYFRKRMMMDQIIKKRVFA